MPVACLVVVAPVGWRTIRPVSSSCFMTYVPDRARSAFDLDEGDVRGAIDADTDGLPAEAFAARADCFGLCGHR
jgi:hypothetical protein